MVHFLLNSYRKKIGQLIVFLLLLSNATIGQVRFTATANETEIGKNDLVQVKFRIENAYSVRSVDPPPFNNFEIVSGPNQESGSAINNGIRSSYAAVSYILKPTKTGKFSFSSATAIIDGKVMKSNTLTIRVSDQSSSASSQLNSLNQSPFSGFDLEVAPKRKVNEDYILRPGEDVQEKIKKNIFLKIIADKTECFVGEPIVVSFKLFTRLLSKTNITNAPLFNGFSVSEMDVNDNGTEERVNGKKFNCFTLRKVQLFPMRPGTFTISPLESENKVSFVQSEKQLNDLNDDPIMRMMQEIGAQGLSSGGGLIDKIANLTSNSLTIHVRPLPAKNKPEDFKGAVGKFSISCTLQNEHMTTDDAGNLALTISGAGNLALVNAPKISWPSGVDFYDARIKENIDNQQIPASGTKTFNIPFTISKAGNYSLPPVHFTWFDPNTGKYESSVTEPISFAVAPGKPVLATTKKGNDNILPGILTVTGLEWAGGLALIGGLIALLLFTILKKKSKESELESNVTLDDLKNERKESFEIPGNPLLEAYEKISSDDPETFYKSLEACLKKYLSTKFSIPVYEITSERVIEKMDSFNVGIGTTKLFESLIREIDLGLYAKNSHAGQMRNLYDKSSELIALLDKQICKS